MHATQSQSAPVRCNTYTDTSFEPNLRGSKQDGEESVRMDGATAPTTRRERTRRPDAVPLRDSGGRVTKRSVAYTINHVIGATEIRLTLSRDGHVRPFSRLMMCAAVAKQPSPASGYAGCGRWKGTLCGQWCCQIGFWWDQRPSSTG